MFLEQRKIDFFVFSIIYSSTRVCLITIYHIHFDANIYICIFFPGVCMVCLLEGCYIFLGCSGYVWKIMIVGIMLKMKNCTDTFFTRNGWVIQPNPSEINTHIIMVSWNLNHTNQVSHSLTVRQNHKKLRGHENMKITSYYCHDLLIDFLCCLNWNFLKGKYFVGNNELCEELIILVFIPSSFCYYALSFFWWKGLLANENYELSYWKCS